MKKLLVIGATGMVASRFVDLASESLDTVPVDEKILDITNRASVDKYFDINSFDAVINFAAFTNVDAAESQKGNENGIAWILNVDGPRNLARACEENNTFFIQISTDFVFPGTKNYPGPYFENSILPSSPIDLSWYGWTKNRAEEAIKEFGTNYAIIRYGYPFRASPYDIKLDWARNLLKLYNEQKIYPLFTDQTQSVIFIDDLTVPIVKIVNDKLGGVFHISSKDTTTPYDIGWYLLEKYAGHTVELQSGSMEEFLKVPGRTPRPRLGGFDVTDSEKRLGMEFRSWTKMVDDFLSQLKS